MVNDTFIQTPALTVYSASAGAGKTYRITQEYLKLILHPRRSPKEYRRVLAVTFTNKATAEMKERILSKINELASGQEDVLTALCQEFAPMGVSITPTELQQRAKEVRSHLLHDYTRFSVLTIDKFFQRVLQAFVREANLLPGFEVELNTERLVEEAAGKVLENAGGDPQRQAWLWQMVERNIETGKTWNVKTSLEKLGSELFKENFRQLNDTLHVKLRDKHFLQNYFTHRQNEMTAVDKHLQGLAQQAIRYLQQNNLSTEDFKYGKTSCVNYFYKVQRGDYEAGTRVQSAMDVKENWYKIETSALQDAYNVLNPLLASICGYWNAHQKNYNTAKIIGKNFMQLGLLADMAAQVQAMVSDRNVLPLSYATRLIAGLIGGSDTPFIYEKMGTTYRAMMIDEFQDTSRGQWNNFLPLITNSLSSGGWAMVVGDVKQSIYRWRNGDWHIMASQIDADVQPSAVCRIALKQNWRSLPTVVNFNNLAFAKAVPALQQALDSNLSQDLPHDLRKQLVQTLNTAYADVEQLPQKQGSAGYVKVEQVIDNDELLAHEQILARLPELVTLLQGKGYSKSDIAILVRGNKEGREVVDALLGNGIQVVSQDMLQIGTSPLVQLCIALLRMSTGQQNPLNEAFVQHTLSTFELLAKNDLQKRWCLPDAEKTFLQNLAQRSLIEAFEEMVQHYHLNKVDSELPFLQALFDGIIQFSNRRTADVSSFLEWWDAEGYKQPLAGNDGLDAITVNTIHKAKGLEYKVVILPFCDWDLDTKANSVLWMNNDAAPFDAIQQLPVSYEKSMAASCFGEQYAAEKTQSYVDSLNLLYVAQTRAVEKMYLFVPVKSTALPKEANKISHLLQTVFFAGNTTNFEALQCKRDNDNVLECGKDTDALQTHTPEQSCGIAWNHYPSYPFAPRLRIRKSATI
ncbi:DNA helicase [Bacteroidia bacterium]|nr:DNA helicase [Bacteroidia bacterium]